MHKEIHTFGISIIAQIQMEHANKIAKIKAKWQETKSMPRKMKKRIRKSLLQNYAILTWLDEQTPFGR